MLKLFIFKIIVY